ncbi:hypothetical protein B0T21DRAFT_166089 [Apiosordaria backusii]|uniref:Uncharacterized protein n=1 Tax=Apiosordaria backusii TaxID=314023 RepID=A0AA40BNJ4_9PEZI|nr:hypothetical protein B0T21DRAFT_166089 [Apiosordaria backusii]
MGRPGQMPSEAVSFEGPCEVGRGGSGYLMRVLPAVDQDICKYQKVFFSICRAYALGSTEWFMLIIDGGAWSWSSAAPARDFTCDVHRHSHHVTYQIRPQVSVHISLTIVVLRVSFMGVSCRRMWGPGCPATVHCLGVQGLKFMGRCRVGPTDIARQAAFQATSAETHATSCMTAAPTRCPGFCPSGTFSSLRRQFLWRE